MGLFMWKIKELKTSFMTFLTSQFMYQLTHLTMSYLNDMCLLVCEFSFGR